MATFFRKIVKAKDWIADKAVRIEIAWIRWRYHMQNRREHTEQVKSAKRYYARRYN